MSIINNLLGNDSAELLIKSLSSQTGQSKSNIRELLSIGIPVILKHYNATQDLAKGHQAYKRHCLKNMTAVF